MPAKLPLFTHQSPDQAVAWHKGRMISAAQFLADVAHLAAALPDDEYMLNVCSDRYHFTVGLVAAIVAGKTSLLPPTNTPEMVRQLQAFSSGITCLHDGDDCDIDLPQLRYSVPETSEAVILFSVPEIDASQRVAILFTSGSTGTPLPHPKTWGSLVQNVRAEAERLGLFDGRTRAFIGTVPPQHMYGLESTVLLPLQTGNVLSGSRPFYPADICSDIESLPIQRILVSSPVHLRMLLDAELELPKVEMVLSATAPLSPQLAGTIENRFDAPLLEIYGSTETGQVATRRTTRAHEWQLLPGLVLNRKGDYMWAGGGHIEIAAALNDVIEATNDDRFILHGRMTDMINIAGKRNSLASLNHQLNSIPGVLDGAFFMPQADESRESPNGHVVRLGACVVAPGLDPQSLMAALRERMDPVFLPRPLLFAETLPRNTTGKLPQNAFDSFIADAEFGLNLETALSPNPA